MFFIKNSTDAEMLKSVACEYFFIYCLLISTEHTSSFLECYVVVTRSISCLVLRVLASKKGAMLRGVGLVVDLRECGLLRA